MPNFTKRILSVLIVLAFVPIGLAVAAEPALVPCPGPAVTGTVVAVDKATGAVTVDTGAGGLCTVPLGAEQAGHPIVELLGRYFGSASLPALTNALAATHVWLVCPTPGSCRLGTADEAGALAGHVMAVTENADGSFPLAFKVEGQDSPVMVTTTDAHQAQRLQAALARLLVDWQLVEGVDGQVVEDARADIQQLHDDGMGFGVIVKLYAMAAASPAECQAALPAADIDCGVSVDELAAAFRSGLGMGELFKRYGKPDLLGLGQVRQAERANSADDADTADDPLGDVPGCQHANGHNPYCPVVTTTAPTGLVTDDGHGNGHGNGNGNGGGNGNSNGGGNGNGNHGKP